MRLLRVLARLIPLPNEELDDPGRSSKEHNSHCNPSNDQVFGAFVSVCTHVVSVFIDDMHGFALNVCDERGGDDEGKEAEGCETPVTEGYEARTVEEDCDE